MSKTVYAVGSVLTLRYPFDKVSVPPAVYMVVPGESVILPTLFTRALSDELAMYMPRLEAPVKVVGETMGVEHEYEDEINSPHRPCPK